MAPRRARALRRPAAAGLALAVAVAAADQATKAWALDLLFFPPRAIEVAPFLNLVAVWNRGVSFGLLASGSAAAPYLLAGFSAAVCAGLAVWLSRTRRRAAVLALGLVIGGAAGNIVDRLRFGAVADFVDLHAGGYHWPAFNLADACITLGIGLLLLDGFAPGRDGGKRDS